MPPRTRSAARMAAEEYRAMFNLGGQHVDGVPELEDEESRVEAQEEVPEDEEMQDPPPPQSANARMGWTTELWIPEADPKAFFHENLVLTLKHHYPDLQATLEYNCTEHKHPLRRSLWIAELIVKTLDATKGIRKVESKHIARISRDTMRESMADAAYQALIFYRGRRFEDVQYNATYHYPRFVPEKMTWAIEVADASQPKLQAQVELTYELTLKVIELENELHRERKLLEKEQREADDLRAELGRPKLHKRLHVEPILKDAAPEE